MADSSHEALSSAIEQMAAQLGVGISAAQVDALGKFVALLQRWNATYNLTAVRDPAQMLTQHLADCLAVVPPLQRQLGAEATARLLDVGSGGGLPGAVLAIVQPNWAVTCVDTVGKKAAFVRQVAMELRLPNLTAEHARVERLTNLPPFDVITSRAFASLVDFTSLTRHALAPAGIWLAMKGKLPQAEIDALPAGVSVVRTEPLAVPGLGAERCLVWMRPAP